MKDRLGYSPKLTQNHSSYEINYTKSPTYGSYESSLPSQDSFMKNSQPYGTALK